MHLAMEIIREKRHRLPPEAYRGRVQIAFTIDTYDRMDYFADDQNCEIAIGALTEAFVHHAGHVCVGVFMPEHVHLVVSGRGPESDLLALIKEFKQKTTFRIRQRPQPFRWQKDFWDHIIRANEDYGAQIRYILRNPVRRGLVDYWEQWPHKVILGLTWEQLAVSIATL